MLWILRSVDFDTPRFTKDPKSISLGMNDVPELVTVALMKNESLFAMRQCPNEIPYENYYYYFFTGGANV